MTNRSLVELTAQRLRPLIAAREVSCVALAQQLIEHVARVNPRLNALVRFDPEVVMAQARAADQRLAAGDRSPWLGIPVSVKDNLWIGGRPVASGSTLYRDFVAPTDAIAVARLRAAGALVIGSTNCSEFACRGVTTNPIHGTTRNPWSLDHTPGGSSGGAAAATAAGLGCLGLGTDAGGSVRRPAAHTGLVGMKPTAGRVPHAGGFDEPVYGNSVIGLLGRCVADVVDALALLGQPDAADPQCPSQGGFDAAGAQPDGLARLRIAYSPRLGLGFPVDAEVAASVRAVAQALEHAGHRVDEVDPPWPAGSNEEALMPLQLAGLAAIHGERWRRAPWDADPDIARQIEAGLALDGRSVAAALELRKQLYPALHRLFQDHDMLLTPTTPVTAWPIGQPGPAQIEGRPVSPRGHAVFTPIFNHCGVPACSVPCGLDTAGLPIGVQLVGPLHADARVLALAGQVERLVERDFSRIQCP